MNSYLDSPVSKWEPRPYQPIMIDFMLKAPRCSMFVPMGFGKTSACLAAIDGLLLAGTVSKVLILAPLRVARSTWPDESQKWDRFKQLQIVPMTGDSKERVAALRRKDVQIFTINYDNIVWLIDFLGDAWPFDMVIADESTRLKSYRGRQGGVRAKALSRIAHKVKRWVNLTGTPAPNGVGDLWGQMWFIDQGQRLGRTFTGFQNRWFRARPGSDMRYPVMDPLPHAQEEIQVVLKDVCLALKVSDWFDIAEPIVNTIIVELPPVARKHYKEMETEMFTCLAGEEIEAFGAAAKTIKCLQLANGAAYTGGSNTEWAEVHDEKIEALRSIIEETSGVPLVVAYHFRSDLARLLRAFPGSRGLDSDPNTITDWNAGRIKILLAHPASAGHGLNLADGGNILVYFGHWWNLEERQQIVERIGPVRQKQAGHDRPVFIYNIVARNTVDDLIIKRIETKRGVQDLLLEAMKHREETV